jgi:tetratricopeptide (TPR) repeat protein
VYVELGKHQEAETLYKRALSIYKSQPGTEHPIVASILSSLAALLRKLGNSVEADELIAQAEAILGKHADLQPSDWLHPNARGDESN